MAIVGDDAAAVRVDCELVPVCGFAQFDDPNAATSGKAFSGDGEIRRFQQIDELESSVLWITNLGAGDDPLSRRRHLRCGGFLGATSQEIARDLGLEVRPDGRLSDTAGVHVAGVFERAIRVAARSYGADSVCRWVNGLKGDYLYQDIAKSLPRGPLSAVECFPRQKEILASAYQARAIPDWGEWELGSGATFVTLRFNRLSYARQMLQMAVPTGKNWAYVEGTAGADVLGEMLARTCLVRAEINAREGQGDLSPVTLAAIGFDGETRGRKRGWFSQPELAALSEFMDIRPDGFLVDEDGGRPLPAKVQLPEVLTSRPERALAYAFGLIAYCHWQAVATPRQLSDRDTAQIDIWSIWLHAMDRSLMHEVALRAHRDDLHVEAYGHGALVLRLQDGDWEKANRFWKLEGFAYPSGGIGGPT
ncbi:hypothetical protein [Achromobacter sp. DH1f]|uniref:hypothetical protein n=1 Tax=Achromobacter sp. DH1f TaxID=1397275 RepID=UPI0009E01075|nr:hypothetical protein [Achromobacter sp. DH1f]